MHNTTNYLTSKMTANRGWFCLSFCLLAAWMLHCDGQTAESVPRTRLGYFPPEETDTYNLELAPTVAPGGTVVSRFVPVYLSMPDTRYPPIRGPVVTPIILGDLKIESGRYEFPASVTLVRDSTNGSCDIMVDTGVALYKNTVIGGLAAHGLRGDNIEHLVLTHRGLDSSGNINLFPNAQIYAGSKRIFRETFYDQNTALDDNNQAQFSPMGGQIPSRRLCENSYIYLTPGYTDTDLSLVVRNVQGYGSIAIVGNLIMNQNSLRDTADEDKFSSDAELKRMWHAIQREIICIADYIIPGHGKTFRVTRLMKRLARCTTTG